jgi:hypothetical protein
MNHRKLAAPFVVVLVSSSLLGGCAAGAPSARAPGARALVDFAVIAPVEREATATGMPAERARPADRDMPHVR